MKNDWEISDVVARNGEILDRKLEFNIVRRATDNLFLNLSSKESIWSALIKSNIFLRDKDQHHGSPSQLKFGVERKALSSVEHKAEQRTVDIVRQMKAEGLSLRGIARYLNQMKVPTKNKGMKWHPEMVRRII